MGWAQESHLACTGRERREGNLESPSTKPRRSTHESDVLWEMSVLGASYERSQRIRVKVERVLQ